jgi:hypothetical protein
VNWRFPALEHTRLRDRASPKGQVLVMELGEKTIQECGPAAIAAGPVTAALAHPAIWPRISQGDRDMGIIPLVDLAKPAPLSAEHGGASQVRSLNAGPRPTLPYPAEPGAYPCSGWDHITYGGGWGDPVC